MKKMLQVASLRQHLSWIIDMGFHSLKRDITKERKSYVNAEWCILLLLLISAILRFWGISFGLPYVYHPDEGFEVNRALRLGMGQFDFGRPGKGGLYFLLFLEYGITFVFMRILGFVQSVNDFASDYARDPTLFWLIGRATNAFLGTLTVFIVYKTGRLLFNQRSGLLAASFLAVSYIHVKHSHYITVDILLTLFVLLVYFFLIKYYMNGSSRDYWYACGLAGCAIMTKLPGIVILLAIVLTAWIRYVASKGIIKSPKRLLMLVTLGPVFSLIVATVGHPYILMSIFGTIQSYFTGFDDTTRSVENTPLQETASSVAQVQNLWNYYAGVAWTEIGTLICLLALGGILLIWKNRNWAGLVGVCFSAAFYILLSSSSTTHLYYKRYMLPILPFMVLWSGFAIDRLMSLRWVKQSFQLKSATILIIIIGLAPSFLKVLEFNYTSIQKDSRTMAVEWVEANIPEGSAILLEGNLESTAHLTLPLKNTGKNIDQIIAGLQEADQGKAKYWKIRKGVQGSPTYNLMAVGHTRQWESIKKYKDQGIRYVIVDPSHFEPSFILSDKKHPDTVLRSRDEFYQELQNVSEATKVAVFLPSPWRTPGRPVEIYRLDVS